MCLTEFCFFCSLITRISPPEIKEDTNRISPHKSISSPLISRTKSSERDSLPSRDSLPTSVNKLDNVLNNNTIQNDTNGDLHQQRSYKFISTSPSSTGLATRIRPGRSGPDTRPGMVSLPQRSDFIIVPVPAKPKQNNTNGRCDERINASVKSNCKIDDELNNNTAQNESIERTDTQINASVYADINNNIDESPFEPIELNLKMESISVCLNEKISVKTSFHNVGDVQFSLMIYFKKMQIIYRVGDFHPGRGFFACCGYLEKNLENLNLFFIDEDFDKPSNVSYIYYLKKQIVPTHRLKDKVTIML